MAANLKSAILFGLSPLLYRHIEDFRPRIFFATNPNDDLKLLISEGGGHLIENKEEAEILLCENKTDPEINDGYLPYDFLVDCVMQNIFLSIQKYRADILRLNQPTSIDITEESDFVVNESGPTESSRVMVENKAWTGKEKYKSSEDLDIITYLIRNDLCDDTSGYYVWKKMEAEKLTSHSYQSLKARFKFIMGHIDTYSVPEEWIAKLKNSKAGETQGEEEDDATCSFGQIDEWERKDPEYKKGDERFKTSNGDNLQEAQCSDDDLYTTDISPIKKQNMVNDSQPSESISPVIIPSSQNDSMLSGCGTLTIVSPGHKAPLDDSSPSGCNKPRCNKRKNDLSPSQSIASAKRQLNGSSPSICITPTIASPGLNAPHDSSPSQSITTAKLSPTHNEHQNGSSSSECITGTSTRISESTSHAAKTTRQIEDLINSGASASSSRKQLQNILPPEQSTSPPFEMQLCYPERESCALQLSFEINPTDSEDEDSNRMPTHSEEEDSNRNLTNSEEEDSNRNLTNSEEEDSNRNLTNSEEEDSNRNLTNSEEEDSNRNLTNSEEEDSNRNLTNSEEEDSNRNLTNSEEEDSNRNLTNSEEENSNRNLTNSEEEDSNRNLTNSEEEESNRNLTNSEEEDSNRNPTISEEEDPNNLSKEIDLINEGIIPDSQTAPQEGANCEAAKEILERKIKYLTQNLKLERLEALYLLKAFQGNLMGVLKYLHCKK